MAGLDERAAERLAVGPLHRAADGRRIRRGGSERKKSDNSDGSDDRMAFPRMAFRFGRIGRLSGAYAYWASAAHRCQGGSHLPIRVSSKRGKKRTARYFAKLYRPSTSLRASRPAACSFSNTSTISPAVVGARCCHQLREEFRSVGERRFDVRKAAAVKSRRLRNFRFEVFRGGPGTRAAPPCRRKREIVARLGSRHRLAERWIERQRSKSFRDHEVPVRLKPCRQRPFHLLVRNTSMSGSTTNTFLTLACEPNAAAIALAPRRERASAWRCARCRRRRSQAGIDRDGLADRVSSARQISTSVRNAASWAVSVRLWGAADREVWNSASVRRVMAVTWKIGLS